VVLVHTQAVEALPLRELELVEKLLVESLRLLGVEERCGTSTQTDRYFRSKSSGRNRYGMRWKKQIFMVIRDDTNPLRDALA